MGRRAPTATATATATGRRDRERFPVGATATGGW